MKGHSSRLEQAEDRILEHKDDMVIKGKAKKLLVRQLISVKGICKNSPTPSKDQT
jgi:hypothetical protein